MLPLFYLPHCHTTDMRSFAVVDLLDPNKVRRLNSLRVSVKVSRMPLKSHAD